HELWCVFFNAVEETLNQFLFIAGTAAERPDTELVTVAQRAGNRYHAMQVQRQKIPARLLPSTMKSDFGNKFRGFFRSQRLDLPRPVGIGNGFYIKNKNGIHALETSFIFSSTRRCRLGTTTPAELFAPSVARTCHAPGLPIPDDCWRGQFHGKDFACRDS